MAGSSRTSLTSIGYRSDRLQSGLRVVIECKSLAIVFAYWLFCNYKIHTCISHILCICIRVAAAAEEVVFEVVTEPQEPLEQEEGREIPAQGPVHPSTEQQPEGKPRCITPNSKFIQYI